MLIIPAIDLRHGRCVRLLRGDFERETVYDVDPVAVARRWHAAGARMLHVVDLDGARGGRPVQLYLIREIAAVIPVQVGGGLRMPEDVDAALGAGIERVVLGTAALNVQLVRELAETFGARLVVALDTRDGQVSVRGWTETSQWTMLELATALIDAGVRRFLHTDVERDGTLTSPNYASLKKLVALGAPVLASGGISSLEHVRRLRDIGVEAAIVGRALYEGTIDMEEAQAVAG